MVSNKLFYIEECWFNLPDNFNGTCGDALMLLAKYRLEQESKNKIGSENELLKRMMVQKICILALFIAMIEKLH